MSAYSWTHVSQEHFCQGEVVQGKLVWVFLPLGIFREGEFCAETIFSGDHFFREVFVMGTILTGDISDWDVNDGEIVV